MVLGNLLMFSSFFSLLLKRGLVTGFFVLVDALWYLVFTLEFKLKGYSGRSSSYFEFFFFLSTIDERKGGYKTTDCDLDGVYTEILLFLERVDWTESKSIN